MDTPEQQEEEFGPVREPSPMQQLNGGWKGRSLMIVAGTEPGATLEGIWAYEPRHLYLVFDSASPASRRLATRVADLRSLQAESVRCIPLDELDGLDLDEDINVHNLPGDTRSKIALLRWQRRCPHKRTWCGRSGDAPAAVGLEDWASAHAPYGMTMNPASDLGDEREAALAVLHAVATSQDSSFWHNLAQRREEPRVQEQEVLACGWSWPLSELPLLGARVQVSGEGQNGKWWEICVLAALADAGVDEAVYSFRANWPRGNPDAFRDDLDVVTRHGAHYVYWSCKTKGSKLEDEFDEARGQADRLLGRYSTAVVVVPKLKEAQQGVVAHRDRPGLRPYSLCVDATFLVNRDRLQRFAAGDLDSTIWAAR
jgi:hypothetical protein